jgi:hypothetical protein
MKRKVTDLNPNEAILISNDAERDAILQLMEDAGCIWNSGDAPFDVLPIRTPYPYCLAYKFRSIDFIASDGIRVVNKNSFYEAEMIYPATDFIGSEGESLEADKKVMITINLSMDKDTAFRIGNVLKQHEPEIWELLKQEIRQAEIKLTRNTLTNEQR